MTEHSSAGMQWPLQPERYIPYEDTPPYFNGLALLFIGSRNVEQNRVDNTSLKPQWLSAIYPTGSLQWCGPIFFICSRNLEQSRVGLHMSSLPLSALQRLNTKSSSLHRSVVYCHSTGYNRIQWVVPTPARCDFGHSIGALSLVTQLRY